MALLRGSPGGPAGRAAATPPKDAPVPADSGRVHRCPLCQRSFPAHEIRCHDGCPLARRCGILCCPHCGYEFVDTAGVERRLAGWGKLWRGLKRRLGRNRS